MVANLATFSDAVLVAYWAAEPVVFQSFHYPFIRFPFGPDYLFCRFFESLTTDPVSPYAAHPVTFFDRLLPSTIILHIKLLIWTSIELVIKPPSSRVADSVNHSACRSTAHPSAQSAVRPISDNLFNCLLIRLSGYFPFPYLVAYSNINAATHPPSSIYWTICPPVAVQQVIRLSIHELEGFAFSIVYIGWLCRRTLIRLSCHLFVCSLSIGSWCVNMSPVII